MPMLKTSFAENLLKLYFHGYIQVTIFAIFEAMWLKSIFFNDYIQVTIFTISQFQDICYIFVDHKLILNEPIWLLITQHLSGFLLADLKRTLNTPTLVLITPQDI